jgi:hypothetical protein
MKSCGFGRVPIEEVFAESVVLRHGISLGEATKPRFNGHERDMLCADNGKSTTRAYRSRRNFFLKIRLQHHNVHLVHRRLKWRKKTF